MRIRVIIFSILVFHAGFATADAGAEVDQLQRRWAEVNYTIKGRDQLDAFEELAAAAEAATGSYPDDAGLWIWSGIIKSTYAGAKGGLGALGLAKQAKRDLEKGMEIEPDTLGGSAYATLGTLYFSVPGWPVGFGNNGKAEELLLQALALNAESIDNNYFYASYLIKRKRYDEARTYLERALQAPPRPNRPLADAGRQEEIRIALEQLESKL